MTYRSIHRYLAISRVARLVYHVDRLSLSQQDEFSRQLALRIRFEINSDLTIEVDNNLAWAGSV